MRNNKRKIFSELCEKNFAFSAVYKETNRKVHKGSYAKTAK